ncbi:2-oxo-tetronate isomerase [Glacieibacterium sp.]|uniref:2-oxo-tetronate isomerase n=1 Tax=Glacieibacterium sp. TaxID=2860237 RepID=UPI003AFFB106
MIKLAANLSMMFTELPFMERFGAAAAAGFKGVEYLFPYEEPAERIRAALDEHGLTQVLFNAPPGDWAAGERGIGGHPDRVEECRKGIDQAIEYARALGCANIHLMAGIKPASADHAACLDTLVANLGYVADAAAPHGITIFVEAINSRVDMPGFIVDGSAAALAVIDRVGRDNVLFQYDIYHMQIMEGDLARAIERLLPRIGHIQLADNPGRNEPGTGEINYAWLLPKIDALGYQGWIGCEYRPAGNTVAGLGWATPWLGTGHSGEAA